MNNNTLIELSGVSKKYCKSLKRSMFYGIADIGRNMVGLGSEPQKLRKDEFWAVEDVSLEIKRGEAIGLIGPNGSGKTTILKMINGIFWPDKGRITVHGRMGALIAVGAGFHPMLTGRENVYLNGAILGMTKDEVNARFDEIIDFADVGEFIDSPVKQYSSGMYVRLGFAVAIHCNPDILLVDEVLAVGDMSFQIKCYQKIHELKKQGTTIILVTHNVATIREQTTRSLYINHGQVRYVGTSDDASDIYIKDMLEHKPKARESMNSDESARNRARIAGLGFYNDSGVRTSEIPSGEELTAIVECDILTPLVSPIFSVNFYDDRGVQFCANSFYDDVGMTELTPGRYRISINFPNLYLPYNIYLCSVTVADEHPANLLDWHNKAYRIMVTKPSRSRGSLKLPTKWGLQRNNGSGEPETSITETNLFQ